MDALGEPRAPSNLAAGTEGCLPPTIGRHPCQQHPRLVGDTTGDRLGDIVGFGYAGVLVSRNNGNSFSPTSLVLNDFGYDAGNWRVEKHVRYVSDLRKKGYVDIIGFGDAGVLTSLNDGDGSFAKAKLVLGDFGYNAGNWRIEKHLRFLADVTGNGTPDIIGFGETNVFVALGKGDGTFDSSKVVVKNDLTYSGGNWRIEKHPRTVADLTGKGRVDIIGFGDAGVYVALNNGDGTFQAPRLVVKDFGAELFSEWEQMGSRSPSTPSKGAEMALLHLQHPFWVRIARYTGPH